MHKPRALDCFWSGSGCAISPASRLLQRRPADRLPDIEVRRSTQVQLTRRADELILGFAMNGRCRPGAEVRPWLDASRWNGNCTLKAARSSTRASRPLMPLPCATAMRWLADVAVIKQSTGSFLSWQTRAPCLCCRWAITAACGRKMVLQMRHREDVRFSGVGAQLMLKIILPMLSPPSIRAWASAALVNGKTLSIIGKQRPAVSTGHTFSRSCWAMVAFSSLVPRPPAPAIRACSAP